MLQKTKEAKPLQWHPAFYASLQIELEAEADKLIFENEHTLGTKPMQIDVIVIKKETDYQVKKNLGQIFRTHNIVEYKSPEDYLSIDDFYKAYGYTCFYKASTKNVDEISVNELSITFVCKSYPKKLAEHLKEQKEMTITEQFEGIYYIVGDIIAMQLIVTSELTPENNLWLKSLTNDIKEKSIINQLTKEYSKHKREELYKSAMNIIVHANNQKFEEVGKMCEALYEIFKPNIEEAARKALDKGIQATINTCKSFDASREKALSIVMENFKFSEEEAEECMKLYW